MSTVIPEALPRIATRAPKPVNPLVMLLRVNLLQAGRKLQAIRQQSRLLSSVILLFVGGYLVLSFYLFHKGLKFVETFPGLGTLLTERLLFLLFAFLFVLLLFSNLIISYTNLFRSRETNFLLTLPVSRQTIYQWKFIESTLLASWAFLFLVAPLLAAYGMTRRVPWHFYPVSFALLGLFIVLPSVFGSWLAVNLARFMDRRAFQVAVLTLGAVGLLVATVWLKPEAVTDEMLETRVLAVLDRLLMKTRFALFPLLPSYWLSSGVLNWSEGALAAAGFFALVLLSHALFFGYLAFTTMGGPFYEAFSTVQSRGSVLARWGWFQRWQERRRQFVFPRGPLELLCGKMSWIEPPIRALMVKDIRVFWRDTTQWGQTLVLFGLLGVYVLNLRHFSHQLTNPFWVNLVSYLNLGACSLNLATLTTRFVYPQFSLEGKRLWIVGMAPLGLTRIVRAKFVLAGMASLVVTLGLVWLSCHMLRMPWHRTVYFVCAITVMTFTLNALAVGLGALYPNFKEENPSKIVSGFGGTFCLVLSFLYILASVVCLAFGAPWGRWGHGVPTWLSLGGGAGGFIALSFVVGYLPLRAGLKRVEKLEI